MLAALVISPILLGASTAGAAEVSVTEAAGVPNRAELSYIAAQGEDNDLQIKLIGDTPDHFKVELLERKAALTAGSGCTGGGLPESPAICDLHKPVTSWSIGLTVDLSDGTNTLEASNLILHPDLPISYTGGAGQDVVVSGGGNDVIDAGAGANSVYGNTGDDEFLASAVADAGDTYGGGQGTNRVSYARRSQPVRLHGITVDGPEGPDYITGVSILQGGTGDDTLIDWPADGRSPIFARLEGGPGNDQLASDVSGAWLVGGPGDDSLSGGDTPTYPFASRGPPPAPLANHLIGEEGNDVYVGGSAPDFIREYETDTDAPAAASTVADLGSDDTAYGNGANDLIELGAGSDTVYGGPGNDWLNGGLGSDLVGGGGNADIVVGDRGVDRLFGAAGSDRIFAARAVAYGSPHPLSSGPFEVTDEVGCGPDRDKAFVARWDSRRGCEELRVLPPRTR
ncbi:MAG TPA: calcium-binding protein [Solirubrobacterales bacterium]|jgi:Ca2+-binding RTX toxin-like protein